MDLKKHFSMDKAKEVEGAKMVLDDEGAFVMVARWGNPVYEREFENALKPHITLVRRGTMPEALAEKIQIKVMSKAIVTGWGKITDDGKEIKYSPKAVVEMLTKYSDFKDQIKEFSVDLNNYKIIEDKDSKED